MNLGFEGEAADRGFLFRPQRSMGVRSSWASFGPGGAPLSRPRPRLRPGAQVSAQRAVDRVLGWAALGRDGPPCWLDQMNSSFFN
jgi:hypothetical protein